MEDFNDYIRKLPPDKKCYFMIDGVIPLCNTSFRCPYKGKDEYPHKGEKKRECRRDKLLHYKKMLGG